MGHALSWGDFLTYGLGLGLTYLLLRWTQHRLQRGTLYLEAADAPVRSGLRIGLLVLDPLLLFTFVALFVAVWPLVHGIIVGLLLAVGMRPFREYVAGRIMRFDQHLRVGKHLIHGPTRGVINGFGLTGLYVQQEEGRTRVSYRELLGDGYTVAVDPGLPAYYHLLVTRAGEAADGPGPADAAAADAAEPKPPRAAGPPAPATAPGDELERVMRRLRDRLVESPYVKRGFTIAPHPGDAHGYALDLDVGLHRGDHVRHLILQLREAGFEASLVNR